MNIIYTKSYEKGLKKLKRHVKEYQNLLTILDIIENADNFDILVQLPIVHLYRFERLKHKWNEYYSFNLSKSRGKIRLIIKPNENNKVEVYIGFISFDHYEDFEIEKVIYYDE